MELPARSACVHWSAVPVSTSTAIAVVVIVIVVGVVNADVPIVIATNPNGGFGLRSRGKVLPFDGAKYGFGPILFDLDHGTFS